MPFDVPLETKQATIDAIRWPAVAIDPAGLIVCHNAEWTRLQAERVAAFRELRDDVVSGGYPAPGHQVAMPPDELDTFLEGLG